MTGTIIPAGSGILVVLNLSGTPSSLTNIIISDSLDFINYYNNPLCFKKSFNFSLVLTASSLSS